MSKKSKILNKFLEFYVILYKIAIEIKANTASGKEEIHIMDNEIQACYTQILKEELIPALGCTEPIALAYGAAYARRLLGSIPERYLVQCSGNIIKNTAAVTVPQTDGMRGIPAAVLCGSLGGNPDLGLEVLTSLTQQDLEAVHSALDANLVTVEPLDTPHPLHIIIRMEAKGDYVKVELIDAHTRLGNVEKNGELLHCRQSNQKIEACRNHRLLNTRGILEYADCIDLDQVREPLEQQITYNTAISQEGLTHSWGASVGKTLLECEGQKLRTRLKAAAAAGSDARMNGCSLPVVINSGSGNQGITVSMPVILYAQNIGASHEKLLRALCVSNLMAIHQKTGIGRLSAFCGAVSAATGAVTGIAYLDGASYEVISQMVINSLANVGGMVCDGAKSSCAAKIASALESALLGYEMAKRRRGFVNGEGIVKSNVEDTIASVSRMAAVGMCATDQEILKIMVG